MLQFKSTDDLKQLPNTHLAYHQSKISLFQQEVDLNQLTVVVSPQQIDETAN